MHRRRVLQLLLAAIGSGLVAGRGSRLPPLFVHRAEALGTTAVFTVAARDSSEAEAMVAPLLAELRRLEKIFSLYDPDSALSRLNRDGVLAAPPFELIELLQLCARLHTASQGAFDPTVQPLYAALAEHFARSPRPPSAETIDRARASIGFYRVGLAPGRIQLPPGMALTLNGIAQGHAADRLVTLARSLGAEAVLIDTGELAASAPPPGKRFWEVMGRVGPGAGMRVSLATGALAVSHAGATRFEPTGHFNHLLDPRSGRSPGPLCGAMVVAETAALADGLSTALCLLAPGQAVDLLRAFPVERALLVDGDGRRHRFPV